MNYLKMTKSQEKDLMVEQVNSNITERALRERITELEKENKANKEILRWYKDYIWKIFANDPTQVKLIALSQAIVEHLIPIDPNKAKIDDAYRHEMLVYRWHLALSIEEFCNDYLTKLQDKKFRNEVLNDMHSDK